MEVELNNDHPDQDVAMEPEKLNSSEALRIKART